MKASFLKNLTFLTLGAAAIQLLTATAFALPLSDVTPILNPVSDKTTHDEDSLENPNADASLNNGNAEDDLLLKPAEGTEFSDVPMMTNTASPTQGIGLPWLSPEAHAAMFTILEISTFGTDLHSEGETF